MPSIAFTSERLGPSWYCHPRGCGPCRMGNLAGDPLGWEHCWRPWRMGNLAEDPLGWGTWLEEAPYFQFSLHFLYDKTGFPSFLFQLPLFALGRPSGTTGKMTPMKCSARGVLSQQQKETNTDRETKVSLVPRQFSRAA